MMAMAMVTILFSYMVPTGKKQLRIVEINKGEAMSSTEDHYGVTLEQGGAAAVILQTQSVHYQRSLMRFNEQLTAPLDVRIEQIQGNSDSPATDPLTTLASPFTPHSSSS